MKKFKSSVLGRSLTLLSRKDHAKLVILTLIQIFLSFLDLLGVAIIGLLGTLAVTGIESKRPAGRVASLLNFLNLESHPLQFQAAVLGIAAGSLLIVRTILSIFFTRRTMFFLGRRGAAISAEIIAKLFSQPLLFIQKRTTQETIFALTSGVNTLILGIISATTSLLSDLVLLVVMITGLLFVNTVLALSLLAFFGLIGLGLYRLMHQKIRVLGMKDAEFTVTTNEYLMEGLESYRESIVRNRRFFYVQKIKDIRFAQAKLSAELSFIPSISKYVIESSVVFGALLICAIQFLLSDALHAVGTLSIFLAASTRIAPAVLRIQQGAIGIRGAYGSADPTLKLVEELRSVLPLEKSQDVLDFSYPDFKPEISVKNLSFTYPGNIQPTIHNISLDIPAGSTYAIVGSSGAGKTTLVDLILGVTSPQSGSVSISGRDPLTAIKNWPGATAYVPQNVAISNRSIRENIALGYPLEKIKEEDVKNALEIAQLDTFVQTLPQGLDTIVGERGTRLSGGQRQRLGIARAVFTHPKLLILDEATSSLDGLTESEITSSINALKGKTTILIIAHRLSTVKNSDCILYLEEGNLIATGSFEQVRTSVPNFEIQAKLAGL